MRINVRFVGMSLLFTALILVALFTWRAIALWGLGAGAQLGDLAWADLAGEDSLGTWWTSLLWAAAALLCLREYQFALSGWRYYWLALSVGSILLSADESIMIHEQFAPLAGRLAGYPQGIWGAGWVIAAVPIVAVCLTALIPFLLWLPRRLALALVLSGAVFVLGAVGLEMIYSLAVLEWQVSDWYILLMFGVEETMEIAGVSLFCFSLVWHGSRASRGEPVELTDTTTPSR